MIKILLDPQIIIDQKVGGVSRQFVEIWQHLKSNPDVKIFSPVIFSENHHLETSAVKLQGPLSLLHHKKFKGSSRIKVKLGQLSQFWVKNSLRRRKFDILLPTYYNPYFLNYLNGTPLVLSVFDMIYELLPQYFPPDLEMVQHKKALMYKSSRIIVHSKQTREDIMSFYPDLDISKIDLVPLASSVRLQTGRLNNTLHPYPYLLFVGRRDTYKNFPFFLSSIKSLLVKDKLQLVCAGGDPFSQYEMELIRSFGLLDLVIQKDLSTDELPVIYKHARAFIFPSEYEGFGLPILEAMACGCPVILADNGVFREVAGDAALYFDLTNEQYLRECVEKVLNDENFRNHLIEKGYNREKQFSWELTAKGYYESILKAI